MNDYISLQSVTPDDGGIFTALDSLSVPWKDVISPELIDLQYYGNVSGEKIISPLLYKQLNSDGKLTAAKQGLIASMIFSMFGTNWTKEWNTLSMQYDPIANYDMTEVMTDDETVTDYGKTNTRTNNLTHAKTGTETDAPSVSVTTDDTVHGFNSSDAVPTDGRSQSTSGSDVTTFNTSDSDTGTVTDVGSGSDTSTRNYELTRKGNIGVTSSQQLLQSERDLWVWNYFLDVVFPDVDKILTIPIYAEETDYNPSGVVPTGTINITENGLQIDISRYEFADVMVPNTYTEEDQGKVVSGDDLVSQTSRTITENDTYNTTTNNSVTVNVPNSYSAADEGKVVSNGDLVSQTSMTITENGTYNTTLISELIANIPLINILSGVDAPSSIIGNDGEIYLQYKDISYDDSGLGWYADYQTISKDTNTVGTIQGRRYYKQNSDPALVAFFPISGYIQARYASTDSDGVLNTTSIGGNYGVDYTHIINGVTWYFSLGGYGFSASSPITSDYPVLNETFDLSTQSGAEAFLNAMGVTFTQPPHIATEITGAYLKVNGVWQNLIGSDIANVNTGN